MKRLFSILTSLFLFILMPLSVAACNGKTAVTKQDMNNYQTMVDNLQEEVKQLNVLIAEQKKESDELLNEIKELINNIMNKEKKESEGLLNEIKELINNIMNKEKKESGGLLNEIKELINNIMNKEKKESEELLKEIKEIKGCLRKIQGK